MNTPQSDIILDTIDDGQTKAAATFDDETVWLSLDQMAELFQRNRNAIEKNIRNIFLKKVN